LPMNAISKRPYRGVNFALLSLEAMHRGYSRNLWLTYLQAASVGAHVRSGERGTTVVFWKPRELSRASEDKNVDSEHRSRSAPLLRAYTVFHLSQIADLPKALVAPSPLPSWSPVSEAERILRESGAVIAHGGTAAFYQPALDRIQVPDQHTFQSAERYYGTALHELAHWTGHPSRCDRRLDGRFGDDAYAMEELIAEMGTAFLSAHCRIDGQLHHASYLQSWLSVLRQDKRAIFTAAAKAQAAADFVLRTTQPVAARGDEVTA
jgi:antirestriction protein ArdC